MNQVCVVMSTYNGEKYVEDQINSILNQECVDVFLYIRDDGSSDQTITILNKYKDIDNIHVDFGDNIGFRHSFLKALSDAPDYDYYAFSDHDDYWFPNKLRDTLNVLKRNSSDLAFCNAINSDPMLRPMDILYKTQKIPAFPESLSNGNVHGFLFLFNKKMRNLAIRTDFNLINTSHDFWLITITNFFGKIDFDISKNVALYRRLESSVSNTKKIAMLKKRIHSIFCDEGIVSYYSKILLDYYSDLLNDEQKALLVSFVNYRSNLKAKAYLLRQKQIKVKYKFKILINKY